jgi:cell wall-associated NlpC family hydrolase
MGIDAKAYVTTKWDKRGYRQVVVDRVIQFDVDSAMDTDADTWNLQLGDLDNDLIDVMKRDNEVRVDLHVVTDGKILALHRGYADSITKTEEGVIEFTGRDSSAPAVDSQALPQMHKNMRIHKLIQKEAKTLGMAAQLQLLQHRAVARFYTDGSETYWEKWYRFYRKFCKAWIWVEPGGKIVADHLNYQSNPVYYFGRPREFKGKSRDWIDVEQMEWRKVTENRVGEVWIVGHPGKRIGFVVHQRDPSIRDWIKKPRKILEDADVRNQKQARFLAFEEIFEGKVGAIEIKLTIHDPGFLIRQNHNAVVNLPQQGLVGTFFVVGCRYIAGQEGLFQEVRLRERGMALTRRVPDDPKLRSPDHEPAAGTDNVLGAQNVPDVPGNWFGCFVKAANAWHGQFGFQLFLATLLAICKHETGFQNEAEIGADGSGGKIWHKPPSLTSPGAGQDWVTYQKNFANDPHSPYNPFRGRSWNPDRGVGPMQVTDHDRKLEADTYALKNNIPPTHVDHDQYQGGRWAPCANIYVGAHILHDKAKGLAGSKDDLFIAVSRYAGSGPAADAYGRYIRTQVDQTWLPRVQAAQKAASAPDPASPRGTGKGQGNQLVQTIMACIRAQLGKWYQWAAEGPNTFDCSGLPTYCWSKHGIGNHLGGRSTFAMYNHGHAHANLVYVHKANLLPGDLVFFIGSDGSPGNPGHMGVFEGDNTFIEAYATGTRIRRSSLSNRRDYVGAMRDKAFWPGSAG